MRCPPPVTFARAERLLERAIEDRELCSWCFARKRRYHPEDAAVEAENLRWGATKGALEARGHRIEADGSLLVNSATSDPDPSTFCEVVPPTWIDGEWCPPRSRTICTCGVVDYVDECRSLSLLHTCVDHLVEWYDRVAAELDSYPDEIDEQAAHDVTTQLRQYDCLAGQDRIVLTTALWRGLIDQCPDP